jgi:ribosomal protein L21
LATLCAGLAALAVALVVAPAGLTKVKGTPVAVTAHAGDQATLTLTRASSRALRKAHVKLQAVKPSSHKKSRYVLPTKSGRWNFTAANGKLNLKGGLRLRRGKRSEKLGTMTFSRGAKGGAQLTVKVHGKKIKIFNMARKGVKAKNKGTRQTVSKFTVRLTKQAAKLIDKALRHKVFHAKQKIGSFQVTLTHIAGKPVPGAPGASGTAAPSSGVGVSFATVARTIPGFSATPLGQAGGTLPAPVGTTPIPVVDGTGVTLPIDGSQGGASFDQGTLTGTLPLNGGIQLHAGPAGPAQLIGSRTARAAGVRAVRAPHASVRPAPQVRRWTTLASQTHGTRAVRLVTGHRMVRVGPLMLCGRPLALHRLPRVLTLLRAGRAPDVVAEPRDDHRTLNFLVAGVASALPRRSTALTSTVCLPFLRCL